MHPRAPKSDYLVPFDGSFRVKHARTDPPKDAGDKAASEKHLAKSVASVSDLQKKLYAHNRYAVLLVFQAMDAAGKDGTIRAVMTGINPAGCQVAAFKAPAGEELEHDFLWRVQRALPPRGTIGIFNRSHYEEVLAVRVHPEYLDGQQLPFKPKLGELWEERFQSIREFERHLARNGTVILKFWLNVSRKEQKKRFLARIDDPAANWKFSEGDLDVREQWDDYMVAYQEALNATSRPWAPWYAVPADDKAYMRATVADIIRRSLAKLDIEYPTLDAKALAGLKAARERLG